MSQAPRRRPSLFQVARPTLSRRLWHFSTNSRLDDGLPEADPVPIYSSTLSWIEYSTRDLYNLAILDTLHCPSILLGFAYRVLCVTLAALCRRILSKNPTNCFQVPRLTRSYMKTGGQKR